MKRLPLEGIVRKRPSTCLKLRHFWFNFLREQSAHCVFGKFMQLYEMCEVARETPSFSEELVEHDVAVCLDLRISFRLLFLVN